MKRKYPIIVLSILLTLSICIPTYANDLEVSYITDFSRDVQLCDGAPAAVALVNWLNVGNINGTGQPGAVITVTVYYSDGTEGVYNTTVRSDGTWTITTDRPLNVDDVVFAVQIDANGTETAAEGILVL